MLIQRRLRPLAVVVFVVVFVVVVNVNVVVIVVVVVVVQIAQIIHSYVNQRENVRMKYRSTVIFRR